MCGIIYNNVFFPNSGVTGSKKEIIKLNSEI